MKGGGDEISYSQLFTHNGETASNLLREEWGAFSWIFRLRNVYFDFQKHELLFDTFSSKGKLISYKIWKIFFQ